MIGMLGGTKAMNTKKFLWSDSQISTGTPATSWNVDTGAKVIVSPGWWPDNATTPTYWRTNQTAATGTDYVANTGRFYDFSSLIGTAGLANTWDVQNLTGTGQPHMNATQHEACRSAAQSTFNALAI